MNKQKRLKTIKKLLSEIDERLDTIEELDPYGDMVENFCDLSKTLRHTAMLIDIIDKDLVKLTQ